MQVWGSALLAAVALLLAKPASAAFKVGGLSLAAGGYHTCIVTTEGSVRCWGEGSEGALGYGNADSIGDNEAPSALGSTVVAIGAGSATDISAGTDHTCVLRTSSRPPPSLPALPTPHTVPCIVGAQERRGRCGAGA
jgi:hypothetical protein